MTQMRVAPQLRGRSEAELARLVRDGLACVDGDTIVPFVSGGAVATADFELGTNGNNIATGDPGSGTAWNDVQTNDANNHVTYDNTHVYGTLAAKIDNTGNNTTGVIMGWTTGIGTLTDWYWRTYLYCTANPTSSYRVMLDSNNGMYPAYITSSGTVQSYDLGGLVFTTTTAIALNQWVRLEGHWINSATVGQVELQLFNNPDSPTPTETKTSAANRNTGVSTTALYFGLAGGGSSSGPIWLDLIVAGATSYPGPWTPPLPPTDVMLPGWSRTRFNG